MPTSIEKLDNSVVWGGSMIDRIHLINGGWPIPQFRIPVEKLKEITAGCDRIALVSKRKSSTVIPLNKIIAGGMRVPHLHFENEIILLDKSTLQKYLQVAAEEVAKIDDIADIGEFVHS